jgi:transposase-like protein
MDISTAPSYRGYRFPAEVISHCVWLYFRFCLSFRDVQEMMLERGIEVSHEAVRLWCLKFGAEYARKLRRRRERPGDIWHLDEVFCKLVYLWRAVDQSGEVLDILVQKRRDTKAAKRFFQKLLKGLRYLPRAIVTDKLPSYGAAKQEVMPTVAHYRGRRLNNRGGEFPSAHPRTGASNAPIHVDATCPALPLSTCASLESLPTGTTPHARMQLPEVDAGAIRGVVPDNRRDGDLRVEKRKCSYATRVGDFREMRRQLDSASSAAKGGGF